MKKANEKVLYIIGGVNGAGKSTFVNRVMQPFSDCIYLNPDEMAKNQFGDYSSKANWMAGREVLKILKDTAKQGKPIIWETVLGNKTFFQICDLYRNNGYLIDLTYIFLENEETHRARINNRVNNGGHNINNEILTKRFNNRAINFDKAKKIADVWKLLSNEDPWIEVVAFGNGSITTSITNYDLYNDFYNTTPKNNNNIENKFKKIMGFAIRQNILVR